MNTGQLIDAFCHAFGVEQRPGRVEAIVYCGDGGHLGGYGAYADDENELGGWTDGLSLGSLMESEARQVAAIYCSHEDGRCVGFLVADLQGVHYAEPVVAANSGGVIHPLAKLLGIADEEMFY